MAATAAMGTGGTMLKQLLTTTGHYVIGLAGIGAVSALVATGAVSGDIGVPIITGITTALVGGGIAANANNTPK